MGQRHISLALTAPVFRTTDLSGVGHFKIELALRAGAEIRRGAVEGRDYWVGGPVRPVRLPAGDRAFVGGGLGHQPVTGRADLEAGRLAGAAEAAETGSSVVGRWILYPSSTTAQKPRLELGFCDGPDA